MSKALRMGRVSAKGGFNLLWGLAISSVISAVGVIIVARLLGPSEYGIIAVALTAPNFIQIFREWGMDAAMIRYTAQYNLEREVANVKSTLAAGLLFEIILGSILTTLCYQLSGPFAKDVFSRPDITPLIQIGSLGIFAAGLSTAAQSILTGFERMGLNSFTLILQSILTTALMTMLVILGLGPYGAILATVVAALLAGLACVLILLRIHRNMQDPNDHGLKIQENVKIMFRYGLPISLSNIIAGFLSQFYNFLIAIYATNLMIGNFSVATSFTVLITFFSQPIGTMLFPAFSKLDSQNEKETLQNVFKFSVKYGALLVVPAATAIITLSQPAVATIFGKEYSYAPLFLALLTINSLYAAFGSLSVGNLTNSQGKTRINLLRTLLSVAIGVPMGLILAPRFGIIGLIITSIIAGIPSMIYGLYWVKANYGVKVDWAASAKIFLASTTAGGVTYIILYFLSFSSYIKLILGVAIFLVTFITAVALMRIIDESDRDNLREMSKDFGPLRSLTDLLLNIIQKLTSAFSS